MGGVYIQDHFQEGEEVTCSQLTINCNDIIINYVQLLKKKLEIVRNESISLELRKECRLQDSRFKIQDSRFKIQDSRFKIQDIRLAMNAAFFWRYSQCSVYQAAVAITGAFHQG